MTDAEVYAPHPKQRAVMLCPAEEILYGGSAGSGKSFAIIFAWMQHEVLNKKNAKGLVLRKTMSELEDLIREFNKVFSVLQMPPKWNETKKTFFYNSGATLELGYLDKEDDKYRYHGRQFSFIAWDELTLWKNDDAYRFLLTRLRSASGVKVTVLSTTNPIGVGAGWVKKRWKIDEYPGGMQPFTQFINLKTGEINEGPMPEFDGMSDTMLALEGYRRWTRIFIPGKLSDNPTLDKGGAYRASLMMQPEKIRKALLEGRWDAVDGQFFHEWNPDVHVVPWFKPPDGYRRWMAMDWGTAKPYCCLWATEMPDGSVVIYDELYGQHPSGDADKGTMENAVQVAAKIRERERSREDFIHERYADPSIFGDHGNIMTISNLFVKEGVIFQPGGRRDKEARIALLRQFLTVTNGQTRLKIMANCKNLIRTIPLMMFDEKNPAQYDSKLEDHPVDCTLYLLGRNTQVVSAGSKNRDLNSANISRYSGMGVW